MRQRLVQPLERPWLAFGLAAVLAVAGLWLLRQRTSQNAHQVSAATYGRLTFEGIVVSNGAVYGKFAITNFDQNALSYYINNMEVASDGVWRYFASWAPGGATHPVLGPLHNPLSPGGAQTFLVRAPNEGDVWRIHVGVLRGSRGVSVENRVAVLRNTRSIFTALSPSLGRGSTGYHNFRFAGMLDGPLIPRARPRSQ
jgi:hypothetical protein